MKYISRVILYTSLFCLVLVFQNCQKVEFAGGENALAQKAGAETVPLDQDVIADKEDKEDDDCSPEDDIDAEKEAEEYALECEASPKVTFVEQAKDQSLDHLRGSFAFRSESFASITDTRGHLDLSSASIAKLHNSRGGLRIYGEGDKALIKDKSDSRGKSILCDISASSVLKHRGGILVINGDIDKLEDIRGNVVVINGNIGSIHNVRGTIRVSGGKVLGSVTDFRGVIRQTP